MWNCKYCNKSIPLKNSRTKSSHLKHCNKWKEYLEITLTKEFLKEYYIDKSFSANEISKLLGFESSRIIQKYLRKHDINIRSISESRNIKRNKLKIETTNKKRYGFKNPMKNSKIKNKVKETKLELYGDETYNNHDKYCKTMMHKYGYKYGIIKAHEDFISKPHRIILEYLNSINLTYNTSYNIGKFYVDIFVKNKVIEIYGDFWHANPLKYKPNDEVKYPNKSRFAKNIWRLDEYRIKYINNEGFETLILWEHDILNNYNKCCLMIKEYLDI